MRISNIVLPRLYPIIDAAAFPDTAALLRFADDLLAGGATLLQYRNKLADARNMLRQAKDLKTHVGGRAMLIMNDRADLCLAAGFDGVHVGQYDLSPEAMRSIIGPELCLGLSTHNPEQLEAAEVSPADYIAIGPIFPTSSKQRPDPVVGLEGVRRARHLTRKPLVAIGGIKRANCRQVIDSGADSVAVISDLLTAPRKSAEEFFRLLR